MEFYNSISRDISLINPRFISERKAMDDFEGHLKIEPIPSLITGNGLFYFILVFTSLLLIIASPASARPRKDHSSPHFIHAKAAIVVDTNKSVIYAKNQDVKLPPASTTKLVTAMVALDHLKPEETIVVSRNAARVRSVRPRLRANDELTVENLLHLALMKSINSAAVTLAEEIGGSEDGFVELMNQKAVEIGAVNTRFANASGLPEGTQFTTVYDLTLIMNEALKYPLIKEILGKKECSIATPEGKSLLLRNTNRLLWATDSMIGGKTGYTGAAQHCFVGAFQTEDGPIFTAVLGTTSRNRLWRNTALLSSLITGPQGIASIKVENFASSGKGKVVKLKKKRHLSKRKHKTQPLRLARKI